MSRAKAADIDEQEDADATPSADLYKAEASAEETKERREEKRRENVETADAAGSALVLISQVLCVPTMARLATRGEAFPNVTAAASFQSLVDSLPPCRDYVALKKHWVKHGRLVLKVVKLGFDFHEIVSEFDGRPDTEQGVTITIDPSVSPAHKKNWFLNKLDLIIEPSFSSSSSSSYSFSSSSSSSSSSSAPADVTAPSAASAASAPSTGKKEEGYGSVTADNTPSKEIELRLGKEEVLALAQRHYERLVGLFLPFLAAIRVDPHKVQSLVGAWAKENQDLWAIRPKPIVQASMLLLDQILKQCFFAVGGLPPNATQSLYAQHLRAIWAQVNLVSS